MKCKLFPHECPGSHYDCPLKKEVACNIEPIYNQRNRITMQQARTLPIEELMLAVETMFRED